MPHCWAILKKRFNFDFPNIEVKQAFLKLLLKKYARLSQDEKEFDQFNIYDDFVKKRFKIVIHNFQTFFDTIKEIDHIII